MLKMFIVLVEFWEIVEFVVHENVYFFTNDSNLNLNGYSFIQGFTIALEVRPWKALVCDKTDKLETYVLKVKYKHIPRHRG